MKSLFRVRWGFIFVLLLILQAVAVGVVLYSYRWLTFGEYGLYAPTKIYAQQVAVYIANRLNEKSTIPSELTRWLTTGKWEEPPPFSQAALFWFNYDSANDKYDFHFVDASAAKLKQRWEETLNQILRPILDKKKAGEIRERMKSDSGDYYLNGRIFTDEPRAVAMLTDCELFRSKVIPQMLQFAQREFPDLEVYTSGPDSGASGNSPIFIQVRDDQGKTLAKLGAPGEYANLEKLKFPGYKQTFNLTNIGCTLEVAIPRSFENVWWRWICRGFVAILALWSVTMICWAVAEIRLSKARNNINQ